MIGCNKHSCKMSALLNVPQSALWLQQSESQSGRSRNITEAGAFLKGLVLQTSRLHVAFRLDQEQLHRASWVSMMEQLYPCLASPSAVQSVSCSGVKHTATGIQTRRDVFTLLRVADGGVWLGSYQETDTGLTLVMEG